MDELGRREKPSGTAGKSVKNQAKRMQAITQAEPVIRLAPIRMVKVRKKKAVKSRNYKKIRRIMAFLLIFFSDDFDHHYQCHHFI